MTLSNLIKVAAYSNPATASVMLSATTIQIPVMIISSAKKYLAQAKDFVLSSSPAVQLFLFAAIAYHVFDKTPKIGHYVFDKPIATKSLQDSINRSDSPEENKKNLKQVDINMRYDIEAREALAQTNEKGENPLQQAAAGGNFEAVEIMLSGPHDGVIATTLDVAKQPVLNFADTLVNGTKKVINAVTPESIATKLVEALPDRAINQGATAEEINHADNKGQTLLHIEAENFNTAKDLQVIAKTVKKGGDLGKQDKEGNTPLVKGLENEALKAAVKPTAAAVKPTAVVKVLTDNGKKLTEAAAPIVNNSDKSALITSVVEFAEQKNGVIFGRDNAGKLLEGTLNNAVEAKNTKVVKALIPSMNNKTIANDIKAQMPALKKEVEVREEALDNPCNQNPLKIATTGARDSGIKLSDVKNYMENETVPASHKFLAAAVLLPNAQTMVNDAIIETAVSTTSKVVGWMGDFLAAVGEELGKTLEQESITDSFSSNAAQDYAASAAASTYTPVVNPYSSWMLQNVIELAPTKQLSTLTGAEFDSNNSELMVD